MIRRADALTCSGEMLSTIGVTDLRDYVSGMRKTLLVAGVVFIGLGWLVWAYAGVWALRRIVGRINDRLNNWTPYGLEAR